MNVRKILLILKREYLTRVRKRSFIIMTLLGPLVFAAMLIVPILVSNYTVKDRVIEVLDENEKLTFVGKLTERPHIKYVYIHGDLKTAKKDFLTNANDGLLYIPNLDINRPIGISFYSKGNIGLETKHILEMNINKEIENMRLHNSGVDPEILEKIKSYVSINIVNFSPEGEQKKNTAASTVVGFGLAIFIYLFIFLYGVQVMRGVIEEKTSRIIEVIITSVKPFELMMGKILGIALLALTQFFLWISLSFTISLVVTAFLKPDPKIASMNMGQFENEAAKQNIDIEQMVSMIEGLNFPLLLSCFIFYFMVGYLLYSALFAAVGSIVDNETETQQFMLPVTVPLVLSFIFAQAIISNPDSTLAVVLSMIPLTSPVIMMVRLPFGVPLVEILFSMIILCISFIAATLFAARIYRVGILMYGKKPTYKELSRWLFYK